MTNRFAVAVALVGSILLAGAAQATVITADQGGFRNDFGGSNGTSLSNYLTGFSARAVAAAEYRSFFGFNLDASAATAEAAILNIYVGTLAASQNPPTISLALTSTSSVTSFRSLGTGTVFATPTLTIADAGKTVSITLNADALSAIQSSAGSEFYLSMRVTNGSNSSTRDQFAFGNTGTTSNQPLPTLTLVEPTTTAVPEPMSALLLVTGLAGLMVTQRRG